MHQNARKYFYFHVLNFSSVLSCLDIICEVNSLELNPKVEFRYIEYMSKEEREKDLKKQRKSGMSK
jgi:hypothetical protein